MVQNDGLTGSRVKDPFVDLDSWISRSYRCALLSIGTSFFPTANPWDLANLIYLCNAQ